MVQGQELVHPAVQHLLFDEHGDKDSAAQDRRLDHDGDQEVGAADGRPPPAPQEVQLESPYQDPEHEAGEGAVGIKRRVRYRRALGEPHVEKRRQLGAYDEDAIKHEAAPLASRQDQADPPSPGVFIGRRAARSVAS